MVLEMLVNISHFTVTTPAIFVICLGTSILLVSMVSMAMFCYKRKSTFSREKGGVFLTAEDSCPNSDQDNYNDVESEHYQVPDLAFATSPLIPSPRLVLLTGGSSNKDFKLLPLHNPYSLAVQKSHHKLVPVHRHSYPLTTNPRGGSPLPCSSSSLNKAMLCRV